MYVYVEYQVDVIKHECYPCCICYVCTLLNEKQTHGGLTAFYLIFCRVIH